MVEKSGEDLVRVRFAKSWFLHKCCGISLQRVAKARRNVMDQEGATKFRLGLSLYVPYCILGMPSRPLELSRLMLLPTLVCKSGVEE